MLHYHQTIPIFKIHGLAIIAVKEILGISKYTKKNCVCVLIKVFLVLLIVVNRQTQSEDGKKLVVVSSLVTLLLLFFCVLFRDSKTSYFLRYFLWIEKFSLFLFFFFSVFEAQNNKQKFGQWRIV